MSTYQDEFITDSNVESHTHPVSCAALRKNGFVMIDGFPCKIVEIKTSKPGKHGSAKAHIAGFDIFTGRRRDSIFSTHSKVEVPVVKRSEHEISFIGEEGFINLFNEDMTIRSDLKLTEACATSLEAARRMVEAAERDETGRTRVCALLISAVGEDYIKEVNIKKE